MRILKREALLNIRDMKQLLNKVNVIWSWMGYRRVVLDNIVFQENIRIMKVEMSRYVWQMGIS